jgi:hypothetical protein
MWFGRFDTCCLFTGDRYLCVDRAFWLYLTISSSIDFSSPNSVSFRTWNSSKSVQNSLSPSPSPPTR